MKQLTVYCSVDLEEQVVAALDHAEVEGYLKVGSATGNKFTGRGKIPRSMTWEAAVYVVPGAPDDKIDAVTSELQRYAGRCEIEPCLRLVISPIEKVL